MEIKEQQKQILSEIYNSPATENIGEFSGLLKEIRNYSFELVEEALVKVGWKLKRFSELIDLNHPDLYNFHLYKSVNFSSKLSIECCEILSLYEYAKKINASKKTLDALKDFIALNKDYPLLNYFDSTFSNRNHVRFLSCSNMKKVIRELTTSYSLSNDYLLNALPETSFDSYFINKNAYLKSIENINKQKTIFINCGLFDIATRNQNLVEKTIIDSKDKVYCGFNQIALPKACSIIARMNGHAIIDNINSVNIVNLTKIKNIKMNDFFVNLIEKNDFNIDEMHFELRLVNLESLRDILSEDTLKLFNFMESYPEMNGKSLFDYYMVLFLSLKIPPEPNSNGFYSVKDQNGQMAIASKDINNVQLHLDKMLLKSNSTVAVLLGERDKNFYFISYYI